MKLSPFDFVNSINSGPAGNDLMSNCLADDSESGAELESPHLQYLPFIVNRSLSYFSDMIYFANEMNRYAAVLPNKMHYDFLRTIAKPRKRFSKWAKSAAASSDVKLIMDVYKYSESKALEVIDLFSPEDIKELRMKTDSGGKGKPKT